MTEDRDLKRLIRRRAAKTGESYSTARRQLTKRRPPALSESDRIAVEEYFRSWWAALDEFRPTGRPFREFQGVTVPVSALQAGALSHPNPKVRRSCLGVLDHEVNDQSMPVFLRALADEVPRVRLAALHGLSCQRCKVDPIDTELVMDVLRQVIRQDPSPKVRQAAVAAMAWLSPGDIDHDLREVAASDGDAIVRETAVAALAGRRGARLTRRSVRRRVQEPDQSGTLDRSR